MLLSSRHVLQSQRIILASTSPQRKEILNLAGIDFEVIPSLFNERQLNPHTYHHPSKFVMDTAYHKVMEVVNRLKLTENETNLIIGADTIVTLEGNFFGKPENSAMALNMLKQLSGKPHIVYTGVVLLRKDKILTFHESTTVFMAAVDDSVMKKYVESGEPLGKAGAYAIQGLGGSLIEKIEGDYYNVMGLPLHKLCHHIIEDFVSVSEN